MNTSNGDPKLSSRRIPIGIIFTIKVHKNRVNRLIGSLNFRKIKRINALKTPYNRATIIQRKNTTIGPSFTSPLIGIANTNKGINTINVLSSQRL